MIYIGGCKKEKAVFICLGGCKKEKFVFYISRRLLGRKSFYDIYQEVVKKRELYVGGLGCPSWGFFYRSNPLISRRL